MKNPILLMASAFMLTCGASAANAQQRPKTPMLQQAQRQSGDEESAGPALRDGMMTIARWARHDEPLRDDGLRHDGQQKHDGQPLRYAHYFCSDGWR
jgi:hypothetical protein